MPNKVERRWSKIEWSRVSKAAEIEKAKARYLLTGDSICEMDGHVMKAVWSRWYNI